MTFVRDTFTELRIRWEPIVFTNAGSRATKIKQLTEKMEPFG